MKKEIDFKTKSKTLKNIGDLYIKGSIFSSDIYTSFKESNQVSQDETLYLNDQKEKSRTYYLNILKFVDLILDNLEKEQAIILRKDYFTKSSYNWWYQYYSRSTYYRLKNKAMSEFLKFYEDNEFN